MIDCLKQLAHIVGRELARRWLEEIRVHGEAECVVDNTSAPRSAQDTVTAPPHVVAE